MKYSKLKNFVLPLLALVMVITAGCGSSAVKDEDITAEVEAAVLEKTEDNSGDDEPVESSKTAKISGPVNNKKDSQKVNALDTPKVVGKEVYYINPFLGYKSTSTSYDIKYTIQTDSGVVGFSWGSMDGCDGEYYLWAFDLTDTFPKLYTSRRTPYEDGTEGVWEEEYTNLDFMYPEMKMFSDIEHYVEIVVDGKHVSTYLDSYLVNETDVAAEKNIGQIGVWVQKGNFHALFDDFYIVEGVHADGDYLYSEDFSGEGNIFSPYLKAQDGRLYAGAGYVTVLREDEIKSKMTTK